jgi:hypothetical protein
MSKKTFTVIAKVGTENATAILRVLEELVPRKSITRTEEGFLVRAALQGGNARDLNRIVLSALRRVERRTRLRAEWKSGTTVERFFDYVPKGMRRARDDT